MILISNRTHVNTVAPPASDADRPRLGIENVFTDGTIAASTTATGYYADNVADGNTYDFWKATALPANVAVTLTTAATCDYVGIAAHNLGTSGATITAQYYDGAAWQDAHTATAPSNDKDLMILFDDDYSSTQWRLYITGSTVPIIGLIHIGKTVTFPKGFYVGHTPINLGRKSTLLKNISDGGYDLGVSHLHTGADTSVTIDNITKGWVRNNLETINTDLLTSGFFFLWRPDTYPNDAAFCWLNREITATNNGNPGLMSVNFSLQGHVELGTLITPYIIECFSGYLDQYANGTDNPATKMSLISSNNYLVGASRNVYVYSVDVSDPSNMSLADQASGISIGATYASCVSDDGLYCFAASRFDSVPTNVIDFGSWDCSDPTNITGLDKLTSTSFAQSNDMVYDATRNYVYVASGFGDSIIVVDVSDPNNLDIDHVLARTSPITIDWPNRLALNGDYLYVVGKNNDAFASIDLTASPIDYADNISGGNLSGPRFVVVHAAKSVAYVSNYDGDSISVIDISDPTNLSETTNFTGDGVMNKPAGMYVDETNNVLYVVNAGDKFILTFSVSDPANPELMEAFDTEVGGSQPDELWDITIDETDKIMYVTGYYRVRSYQLQTCGCTT